MVSCKLLTRSLLGLVTGPLHLIRVILVREFANCGSMAAGPSRDHDFFTQLRDARVYGASLSKPRSQLVLNRSFGKAVP